MSEDPDQFAKAVEAAAVEYDADIYFYSGAIDDGGFGQITREIANHRTKERAILILVTNGGQANSGYQIARIFQRQYREFVVFCPSRCKSAGTLVALGAHRLIMDVFSELGPLDVQLIKQNEIASRKSGLLAKSSFDALGDAAFDLYEKLMISITLKSSGNVSFQIASELSAKMASTMLAPVYSQINPEIVGGENRDLQIAYDYGVRLVKRSRNASDEAVAQLVSGYPSHDFIIDSEEASELFANVEEPSEKLYQVVGALGDFAYDEAPSTLACALTRAPAPGAQDNDQGAAPGHEVSNDDGAEGGMDGGWNPDRGSHSEASGQDAAGDEVSSGTAASAGQSNDRAGDNARSKIRAIKSGNSEGR